MIYLKIETRIKASEILLSNIKSNLPKLKELLTETKLDWNGDDGFYRFYHQSFKVFGLQSLTQKIVEALTDLSPLDKETLPEPINEWFLQIIRDGTGKTFEREHNRRWLEVTRPIVEAFFHAQYFLGLVCKNGDGLEESPQTLPSGWAAVLYLYNIR